MVDGVSVTIAILAIIIAIVAIILIFALRVQGPPGNAGVWTYQAITTSTSTTTLTSQYGKFFEITSSQSNTIILLETDTLLTPGTSFIILNNTPNSAEVRAGPNGAYGFPVNYLITNIGSNGTSITFFGIPNNKIAFATKI